MTSRQRSWLLPPASLALVAGVFLGRNTDCLLYPLCASVFLLLALFLLNGRLRFIASLITAFVIGVLGGCIAFHPILPAEGDYMIRGVISDEVSYGSFGQYRLCLCDVSLDGRPFPQGAYWTFYADEEPAGLIPGMAVSFSASLYHPKGAVNPNGYDFREYLLQRGITIGLYGKNDLVVCETDHFSFFGSIASFRHGLSVSLRKQLGESSGSFASALLLGMRSLIPSEDRQAFANLGIAHILSVSGFHVGILIGVLAVLFRLFRMKQSVRIAFYALVLFFYSALCGMSQPVIRASLLLLMSIEGRILKRPRSGIHLLSGTLIIMTLFSPVQVTSASFQLTFCAMFGLVWFTPIIRRTRRLNNQFLQKAFEYSVLSFGVQLGLLFPELLFFQRLPLLVFLVNIPATLIFSLLIFLFWLTAIFLPFPGILSLFSGPFTTATEMLLSGVRSLGSLPGLTLWLRMPDMLTAAGIILVFFACCTYLGIHSWTRAGLFFTGTLLTVISLIPVSHTTTDYIQFSTGNADAAVLWDQDKVYVIDTGENDAVLSSFLRANRLTPDAVIVTHLHADHAGGLRSLLDDGIPVPLLFLPEGAESQDIHPDFHILLAEMRSAGTEIRMLSRGDVIPLPSGTMAVLWPEKGKTRPGQDANNYSLVSRLTLKGNIFLQTGDITGLYEHYCAVPADLLKAAHHGSPSSSSDAFLSAVSPDAILLSCKQESRLQSFRDRVGETPVFGTPECGAVTVRFNEGSFTVIPYITN